jgi:hypothetical protein
MGWGTVRARMASILHRDACDQRDIRGRTRGARSRCTHTKRATQLTALHALMPAARATPLPPRRTMIGGHWHGAAGWGIDQCGRDCRARADRRRHTLREDGAARRLRPGQRPGLGGKVPPGDRREYVIAPPCHLAGRPRRPDGADGEPDRGGWACVTDPVRVVRGPWTEFDNIIVVDNVPRVSQEKEEKLKNVLRKTFKPCGEIRENGIHMPRDADPATPGATMTRGFAALVAWSRWSARRTGSLRHACVGGRTSVQVRVHRV